MRRLRVLTWHVHGSYLASLGLIGHELLVPYRPGRPERFWGRPADARWPETIREVPADEVADLDIDVVLYQSALNWTEDQDGILSEDQRRGPRIFLEHDPPREHPTDTRHVVDDPDVLLVHVTAFNNLMWDSGRSPTRVIEHGVSIPDGISWTGELERGIVVANNLDRRGRRLGADLFERARAEVPLDLAGMGAERLGGLGNLAPDDLAATMARYRFYFHPVRYTSLGMSLCEAMMLGLPIVGLATTELPTIVSNGESGFIDTDLPRLIRSMHLLIEEPDLARELGEEARRVAVERFSIPRFARDWNAVLAEVHGGGPALHAAAAPRRSVGSAP
jgi:hypothetical protein